jgi:hypothetical protein
MRRKHSGNAGIHIVPVVTRLRIRQVYLVQRFLRFSIVWHSTYTRGKGNFFSAALLFLAKPLLHSDWLAAVNVGRNGKRNSLVESYASNHGSANGVALLWSTARALR